MAEITNDLMYETLKALRGDVAGLATRLERIESELRSVRHHMAGLVEGDLRRDGEWSSLAARVDRIEKRLELTD